MRWRTRGYTLQSIYGRMKWSIWAYEVMKSIGRVYGDGDLVYVHHMNICLWIWRCWSPIYTDQHKYYNVWKSQLQTISWWKNKLSFHAFLMDVFLLQPGKDEMGRSGDVYDHLWLRPFFRPSQVKNNFNWDHDWHSEGFQIEIDSLADFD